MLVDGEVLCLLLEIWLELFAEQNFQTARWYHPQFHLVEHILRPSNFDDECLFYELSSLVDEVDLRLLQHPLGS